MCLLYFFGAIKVEKGAVEIARAFLGGFLLEDQIWKNDVTIEINNCL